MALWGVVSPAAAQQPVEQPISPEDIAPSFATLDRMDNASRVGIQVGFYKVDEVDIDDAFLMRFDLDGQYAIPDDKMGVYAQLPIRGSFSQMRRAGAPPGSETWMRASTACRSAGTIRSCARGSCSG